MVEGARLESVYAGNRIVGSNPTPSAINIINALIISWYFRMWRGRPTRHPTFFAR